MTDTPAAPRLAQPTLVVVETDDNADAIAYIERADGSRTALADDDAIELVAVTAGAAHDIPVQFRNVKTFTAAPEPAPAAELPDGVDGAGQ